MSNFTSRTVGKYSITFYIAFGDLIVPWILFLLKSWICFVIFLPYPCEDVELRRLFPREFPQDTIRRSGAADPEWLGRYAELKRYFLQPRNKLSSHFEELGCYHDEQNNKVCKVDLERYRPQEDDFYLSKKPLSHMDRSRVFCILLLCFTEGELDRVVASFS